MPLRSSNNRCEAEATARALRAIVVTSLARELHKFGSPRRLVSRLEWAIAAYLSVHTGATLMTLGRSGRETVPFRQWWRAVSRSLVTVVGMAVAMGAAQAEDKLPLTLSHAPIMPFTNGIVAAQGGIFRGGRARREAQGSRLVGHSARRAGLRRSRSRRDVDRHAHPRACHRLRLEARLSNRHLRQHARRRDPDRPLRPRLQDGQGPRRQDGRRVTGNDLRIRDPGLDGG